MKKNWKAELVFIALLSPRIFSALAAAQSPADAIALEQQGKLPEAAQAWKNVTEHNPNDSAAFASLEVSPPASRSILKQRPRTGRHSR